jgi:TolB-like protein/Tfp pilus assembly protein PilF
MLDRHRVAVLPLQNMSPDPNDEYFADGMTEEIISTLSNISTLTVISRTSVMQYKGVRKNLVDIGRELKAGTLLEGSVRKADNRARITVQLLDAMEDRHLWAQSYDRELQDVFAVQSDIARNVAEALRVKLLGNEARQIEKKPTDNTEAYLLYLKGRQRWIKRSEQSVRNAIEYFNLAIMNDANFALAYVGLADCYTVLYNHRYMERAEAAEKTRPAILKALQLGENSAEAHATYGWFLMDNDWNWDAAEAQYKKAIELNPNYATGHQFYSGLLQVEGRLEEALVEAKKALELDPLAPMMSLMVANTLYCLERYDDAIDYCNKALAIEPNFVQAFSSLAFAYAMKGEFDEATACVEKLTQAGYPKSLAMAHIAGIQARAGKKNEALSSLDSAMKLQDSGKVPVSWPAWVFAALHDEDRAIDWLEKAVTQHDSGSGSVLDIKTDPWVKELRTRPRFLEILKKLGLDKY